MKPPIQKNPDAMVDEGEEEASVEYIQPQIETPQKLGFKLEDLIHKGVSVLDPTFICRKEQDIRDMFKDQSINGVDHWITIGKNHILIQDKWCETFTQVQASQFLNCVKKIRKRLDPSENVFLIWASKCSPTKNAQADMHDEKVKIIVCNVSIQALARHVIEQIASLFRLDPTLAIKVIQ